MVYVLHPFLHQSDAILRLVLLMLFQYMSYFVIVGSSNMVRLLLLGNYPDILGFIGLMRSSEYAGSREWFLDYIPGFSFSLLPYDHLCALPMVQRHVLDLCLSLTRPNIYRDASVFV